MTRTLDVRVDVLRNCVKISELNPIGSVNIKMSTKATIKSTLSGSFMPNNDVSWLSDELMPVAIIDGVDNPLGLFSPTTITQSRDNDIVSINVEAYDRCWTIQNKRTENIMSLSAGRNYIDVIEDLIRSAGIMQIIKTPTSSTLTSIREDWEIGTDYLTIVNQLLSEINYNELWFDNNGNAILEPSSMLNISDVERTYNYDDINSMMLSSSTATLDLFSVPNVFLCVCSNPDKSTVMKATSVNENLSSPFSVQRRNKRIMTLIKVDNIASQDELQNYADIQMNKNMFNGQKIQIKTAIRTDCGMNDVVALITPDVYGLCNETDWTIDLCTGGTMTHTLLQQPTADVQPAPSTTGAIAGIAIAGISIVGTS